MSNIFKNLDENLDNNILKLINQSSRYPEMEKSISIWLIEAIEGH